MALGPLCAPSPAWQARPALGVPQAATAKQPKLSVFKQQKRTPSHFWRLQAPPLVAVGVSGPGCCLHRVSPLHWSVSVS